MLFTQPIVLVALAFATISSALPLNEKYEINARADADPSTIVARTSASTGTLAQSFLALKREESLDLYKRSVYDDELYTRSFENNELYTRDFTEAEALSERSFKSFFKKIGSGIKKAFNVVKSVVLRREEEDLQARGVNADELSTRSLRGFKNFFKKIGSGIKKAFNFVKKIVLRRDESSVDLQARAEDELVERNIFGKAVGVAKGFFGFKREEALAARSEEELDARMEEDEELSARFEDEELFTRSEEELYERDFEDEY